MKTPTRRHPGLEATVAADARRWRTLGVLAVSLMIITIDTTILNVALPTLSRTMHASTSQLQWVVDAYILVFAGLLLTAGSLGDRLGRKGALLFGLAVFGAGSLVAGLAQSPTVLIGARCVMGVGGAFIMPTTLSILSNVFTNSAERAKAIGIWTGVAGLGVAIGPLAGGFLLSHFSWNAVFYVNVPLCLAAIVAAGWLVPGSRAPSNACLDISGLGLSVVALTALIYGIIEAPTRGWTAAGTLATWGVSLLAGAAFVWRERRIANPMIDVSVFRNLRFTIASGTITLVHFAIFGAIFVLTAFLQSVLGFTALQAGLRTIPFAAAMMAVAPQSPRIVHRFGSKAVVTAGLLVMAAGMAVAGSSTTTSGYPPILVSMVLMGTGMALTMAPATESVMGSLPREKAGVGSAINDTTREVGGALGVAILGSLFSTSYGTGVLHRLAGKGLSSQAMEAMASSLTGGNAPTEGVSQQVHAAVGSAFIHAMDLTMLAAAGAVLVGAVLAALLLPARARTSVTEVPEAMSEPALTVA